MKRWLLIDDTKRWCDVLGLSIMYGETPENEHPDVEFHVAKTYWAGLTMLDDERWDLVCIDHELGGRGNETGYQLLAFLEKNPQCIPMQIDVCSDHPTHRQKMYEIAKRLVESQSAKRNILP